MSKAEKLLQRLLSIPKDFTWDELIKILSLFGYVERKERKPVGSRRTFANEKKHFMTFHKPHPGNTVKEYVLRQVIDQLKEKGHIKDE